MSSLVIVVAWFMRYHAAWIIIILRQGAVKCRNTDRRKRASRFSESNALLS